MPAFLTPGTAKRYLPRQLHQGFLESRAFVSSDIRNVDHDVYRSGGGDLTPTRKVDEQLVTNPLLYPAFRKPLDMREKCA